MSFTVDGVETLQMMIRNKPIESRNIQMVIGPNKDRVKAESEKDILNHVDAPEVSIPVDAPSNFDVNKLILENNDSPFDDDYYYTDIDTIVGQERLTLLPSAFISNKDPISVTMLPSSNLEAAPGDLIFVKFLLRNNQDVKKFYLTAGVGGYSMLDKTEERLERQRMVFPGQTSFIQTVSPESVLLAQNQTSEIQIGVSKIKIASYKKLPGLFKVNLHFRLQFQEIPRTIITQCFTSPSHHLLIARMFNLSSSTSIYK